MALVGNFYRTWWPGMNEDIGVVKKGKVHQFTRRLTRVNKWSLWIMIPTFVALLILISVIIYNIIPSSSGTVELNRPDNVAPPTVTPVTDQAQLERTTPALISNYSGDVPCGKHQFRCKLNGNCLPAIVYCNGNHDCGQDDFSDETNCTCRQLLESRSPSQICDSVITCADRGDELNCPCQEISFRCNNGTKMTECVLPVMVCDGVLDCSNGLDEADCIGVSSNILTMEKDITPKGLEN